MYHMDFILNVFYLSFKNHVKMVTATFGDAYTMTMSCSLLE
jgi:hypothetical protein